MMRNRLFTGFGLLLVVVLSACGTSATVPPATPTAPALALTATPSNKTITTKAVAIAQMKGHLYASLPNWQAGRYDLALKHGKHPGAELLPLLGPSLKAKGVTTDFQVVFDQYTALMAGAGDAATVKQAHSSAAQAIDEANRAYLGPLADDPAFNALIIARLVASIEAEYSASLKDGAVSNLAEYQDAKGYLAVAQERYSAFAASVKAAHPEADSAVLAQFAALSAALPDYMTPPAPPATAAQVEAAVDGVRAPLGMVFRLNDGAAGPAETDLIAGARTAVAAALSEAAAGHSDAAYEQAVAAYTDNYERLESALGKKDMALMTGLEGQFKALRDGIKAGQPAAELQALAAQINTGLDKAAQLLSNSNN